MSISTSLPVDTGNRRFVGPEGYLPKGTRVGSTDYAVQHALLVAADGTTVLIGQKAMSASIPVVLASNQTGIPLLGTGIMVAASVFDGGAGTGDGQAVAAQAGLRLLGFSCQETTGSATAAFILRNGTSTGGNVRSHVTLGANESRSDWFGPQGLDCAGGIFIDRTSGTSQIDVFYAVVA